MKLASLRARLACAFLAAASFVSANPSTIPGVGYINGTNIAWRSFGSDFGGNGTLYNAAFWTETFNNLNAYKVNGARVWVHIDGRASPTFDSNGDVLGNPSTFVAEISDMLDKANAYGVKVQLCLWSFDMLKDYRAYGGPSAGVHHSLITNATYRANYISRSLVPLVNAIKNKPALLAIELCNEPEWMVSENPDRNANAHLPLAQIRTFFREMRDAIKNAAPNVRVTIGSASVKWSDSNAASHSGDANVGDWWSGLGLDYRSVHYYSWMSGSGYNHDPFATGHTPDYYGLEDLPTVIGEFGGKGNAPYNNGLTQMNRAYTNGYAGHFAWAYFGYFPDGSPARDPGEIAEMGHWPDFRDSLLTFANQNLGGGSTLPAAPSSLGATAPSSTQVNLTWTDNANNESSFSVERKTGAGGTYSVVASNLAANTTSYSSTGLTASTTYVFRVRAANASGNSSYSNEATITTPASGGGGSTSTLQAESGTFGGGAIIQSASNATGGQLVGSINNVGAFSQVTFNATAAGSASLVVRYSNGYASTRSLSLYVNGSKIQQVNFAVTGDWNTFANSATLAINLVAGNNTIRLQRDSTDLEAADIDSYSVTTSGGGGSLKAEAESGVLNGCNVASLLAGYTGAGYVDAGSFNTSPDSVTVTLSVPSAGSYTIRIRYAGIMGDKNQTLLVNDVNLGDIPFPASSTWTNKDVPSIQLNAGSNTIQVRASWGYMHIDSIEIL
ncbi:MAG: CBM35 domain-containing protein [Opitutaceae bacterium]|nr:CBM35 domain-containing protein [Opitutaceae bacterium]